MASITIRNLSDETVAGLRRLAAARGTSLEEEARHILSRAMAGVSERGLATTIVGLFGPLGGVELDIPPRSPGRLGPELTDE